MEIALENAMPSYSGGLGVLAGDTIRAAADIRLPMVAVSLLYRKGFFRQVLQDDGAQVEEPVEWDVSEFLTEEAPRVTVTLEKRRVELRAWKYIVKGVRGYEVPVYFLDADLPENDAKDRELTGALYGGDPYYRLSQEVLLGIGGVRMLRALGHTELMRYHMNEGHAALLTLELLEEEAKRAGRTSIKGVSGGAGRYIGKRKRIEMGAEACGQGYRRINRRPHGALGRNVYQNVLDHAGFLQEGCKDSSISTAHRVDLYQRRSPSCGYFC